MAHGTDFFRSISRPTARKLAPDVARFLFSVIEDIQKISPEILEQRWRVLDFDSDSFSPIEDLFSIAMFGGFNARFYGQFFYTAPFPKLYAYDYSGIGFCFTPQQPISIYRADFLLRYSCPTGSARLVIECDGHKFHERTPAQAKYDRARDRFIQSLGLNILRFTGSEIVNDPFGCADEAIEIALKLSNSKS